MKKLIVLFLLSGFPISLSAAEVHKVNSIYTLPDLESGSLVSLKQVKNRAIFYLLGCSAKGTYRQNAVQEMDRWVQTVLANEFEPLNWEEGDALIMNQKLDSLASRLQRLAIAFRSEGSRYKQNPELKKRIILGINNVLQYYKPAGPRPGNWFQWLISLPRHLGAIGLLMDSDLPPELLDQLRNTLRHELGLQLILTGTNAAWESRNHIYLALLDGDQDRLKRAADYVFKTVRFGTKQGIREDYVYLYHGNIPYAGGYGAGFAQTISEFIYVFDGSPWAISPLHRGIIISLLLEHTRWFLADGQVDLHVRGRSFKSSSTWNTVLEALLVLAQTTDPQKEKVAMTAAAMLKARPKTVFNLTSAGFADKLTQTNGELPSGFRYWPTGEIGVFKQPSFHVGFRQFSKRVQDYEYIGSDVGGMGAEGWNLAYGFTNILREDGAGSWYSKTGRGILPDIDMEHLPGTTSRIGGNPVNPPFRPDPKIASMSTGGFSLNFGTSAFAGGAGWKEGGVAGFVLKAAYGDYTVKKSLHFFTKGFWALGSEIASTSQSKDLASKPIHTTILQWPCNKHEPVITLPGNSKALINGSTSVINNIRWFWIEHENVAVVFQEPTSIFVRLQNNIITAWLDHGSQPSNARYAYAVLPDISLVDARRFARELPFRPVRYDENVHAVTDIARHAKSVVFFSPDSCLGIKTQSPAIVYQNDTGNGGAYTIQDPLHQTGTIQITVDELKGKITQADSAVKVTKSITGPATIEVSSVLGRIYRFGYGFSSQSVYGEPRKDLDLSAYHDFRVEAKSDAEKTVLTVHLPDEAVREGYELSVHFSKSQRLYNFSEKDVLDRPSPNIVRYQWYRKPINGPSVFSNYFRQTQGRFGAYLVTKLIAEVDTFTVPDFNK